MVGQSPNSYNNASRIAYVNEHKYCAHLKNSGIKLTWMKNPENSNCGTINAGIISAATAGSSTQLPMKIPILVLAIANIKFKPKKEKKFIVNPIKKKAANCCTRTCIKTVKHSRVNFAKK
mmetsp:Transcript_16258/g.29484  ORF Transcript_16258/g.29484 Transcript_16258/m.29484 type:complete len:120 (-) Transcript_16258:1429-1788(-)